MENKELEREILKSRLRIAKLEWHTYTGSEAEEQAEKEIAELEVALESEAEAAV